MRSLVTVGLCCFSMGLSAFGCKSKTSSAPPVASARAGSSAAPFAPPATATVPHAPLQLPEGPSLAILAGQGVGSIRIGATVATIERLIM